MCGDGARKYKTPCCKLWYCSVSCYKGHFELKGCSGERKEVEGERERRVRALAETRLRENEETSDETINSMQLEAIGRNTSLRAQLRDPALQELITAIDTDPDRLSALNNACIFNKDFHGFTEELCSLLATFEPPQKKMRMSTPAKQKEAKKLIEVVEKNSEKEKEEEEEEIVDL